jgi:hypothetical protein
MINCQKNRSRRAYPALDAGSSACAWRHNPIMIPLALPILISKLRLGISLVLLLLPFQVPESFSQNPDSLVIPYHYINSIPQNAEVYLNDSLVGFTPLRLPAENVLTGKFTLKKSGCQVYTYRLQPDDSVVNKTFYLTTFSRKSEQLVMQNHDGFFKKPRKLVPIITLGTVSLGSAISAYYFKSIANDKYSEYLQTGSDGLLDETKRYDLYSGIALAALQLGIIGLIYFLFID